MHDLGVAKIAIPPDPRQSASWGKTLSFVGWEIVNTKNHVQIAIIKTLFGSMVKIQRPHPLSEADLIEIETICKKNKALFIKIEVPPNQDLELLYKRGYIQSSLPMTPPKTMYINLTKPKEELWANLSGSAKYSINRAKREGTAMEILQDPTDANLQKYRVVLAETGKRKGFYVEPLANLVNRAHAFNVNTFLIFADDKHGFLDSAKFFVAHESNVLYVHGGTSGCGLKTKAGYLLLWEAILYFKEKGFKTLDLEGMSDARFPSYTGGWGGFTSFKEKFNGDVVSFPCPKIKFLNPFIGALAKIMPVGI